MTTLKNKIEQINILINDANSGSIQAKEIIEEQVSVWNNMALFMGYSILIAPKISEFVPIYLDRAFPGNIQVAQTFSSHMHHNYKLDVAINKFIEQHKISWMPTFDFNDGKLCEQKLLTEGKYTKVQIDHSLAYGSKDAAALDFFAVIINYSDSLNSSEITGVGANELNAICNACERFMKREEIPLMKDYKEISSFENLF